MAKQHGVYVTESSTNVMTPKNGTAGLQVVFGTAPVNRVADPAAAMNKLIIAYSFEEAQEQLGYSDDFKNYTLCQSMDATFRLFNVGPVIFCNVLDPKKHIAEVTDEQVTVIGKQAIIESEGVFLSTISVRSEETALLEGTDYITTFNSMGQAVITLAEVRETILVSYTKLDPSKVTEEDIIGGYDAETGTETGLELIRQIYPKFSLTPGLIIAPGWSQKPAVAAVMQAKCEEINGAFKCECILDIDTTQAKKYSDCNEVKESSGFSSSHAIAVWPKVTAGGKEYFYSAVFAALTAYTDVINGDIPNLSPSNKLTKITGTVLEGGEEVNLDKLRANVLNGEGIVTAINMNGWRSWGNNTAAYPAVTDPKDCWICVRRFFSWYSNSFIVTYDEKVDDPANYRLIESIVDAENIRANSMVPDRCAGLEVEYRASDNPIDHVLDGLMKFRIRLAPYTPAETIIADLEFDPELLQAALTGGE